eukprot:NODE_4474_length_803_cov_16.307692_g4138_i0.p1 GENE.NODE_4474_length_803_cov_16.307692_g4138_i0~~NODE_4474_length_803_cov_16.307692_g4138_i0.p1  ORF type:complete len:180 (-),score=38.67 NODE_4474_length_803_cov_16.307692_g4138_i0:129-668(-)
MTSAAHYFRGIAGVKSYVPFGNLSPQQERCAQLAIDHIESISNNRMRERFLNELEHCITGFGSGESSEPISTNNFSQFSFYDTYIGIIYHQEKFDFLLQCIAHRVSLVASVHIDTFTRLVEKASAGPDRSQIPEWVVNQREMAERDEEARREAFIPKKTWEAMKRSSLPAHQSTNRLGD